MPVLTYVSKVESIDADAGAERGRIFSKRGRIFAIRLVEEGYETVEAPLPCLITVVKEIAAPRLPTLKGKIRSMEMEIPMLSADDLEINHEFIGLKGSPTRVVKIDTPSVSRGGKTIKVTDEESLHLAVDEIMALLAEKDLI
jgi:electron transfer flavoprotein beta subunit